MLSLFKKETPTVTDSISNIKDLVCEGHDYFSDELIILDEHLAGNLFCAEKVVIEQHGVLMGNITSKTCTVTGVVNGDILSLDLLDIRSNAVVRGNIQSATVNIEPGAVINGYITVGEDIEALTEQWNRTKFSTDDYLTTKLNKELTALNKASDANDIVVEQKIEPGLVAAIIKREVKPDIVAAQPTLAAAAPQKAKEEPVNNQRWW
jgi:cytoskeletal protein CcmA (bactofilin family)